MTKPTLVGHVDSYGVGGTTPLHRIITPPSGTVDGDFMIVIMTSNAATYTPPAGWTQLYLVTTGTMKTTAWYKFRTTGETAASATYDFQTSNSVTDIESILVWHGVEPSLAHLVIGATGDRGTFGTSTTNVAPSVTTTQADTTVYTFSSERTTASETGVTSISTGTADYFKVQNGSTGVETLSVSHVDMPTPGASGAVTVTYPNTQSLNGLAVQVGIPGIVATNVAPVAGFSSSTSNLVLTVTSTATDSDGTIASTDYDWGDGTTHGNTANGTHTYASAGTYTVTQTVTDNSGGTNSITHSVTVTASNLSPVAGFTLVANDYLVTVTSTATDGDGTISSTSYNWGDGVTNSLTSHTYSSYGTKTITQTVTDNLGATGTVNHATILAPVGLDGLLRASDGNHLGKLFYWDGSHKHADISIGKVFRRTRLITDLMSDPTKPWFSMHRNASNNYPEMTLYGIQGCLDAGAKIVEVSLQASKAPDNNFWGFHDPTVDRTVVGQTGNVNSFTDAQLATFMAKGSTANLNTGQPNRPIAKFTDILSAFPTTPMIVEDKTYTHQSQLLDLLDANGGPDRFVIKLDSTVSETYFSTAAGRGYATWAYVFDVNSNPTDLTAILAKSMTMLGMDFNSSDSTLIAAIAQTIAAGKIPTGHIISTKTQRDRLLGFGMLGLMMSNKLLLPNYLPL